MEYEKIKIKILLIKKNYGGGLDLLIYGFDHFDQGI